MKITADQIDIKTVAGKTKDGRPVVYIATKGGLHSFFCKDEDDQIVSIGAAPHRAIAKFLAGKKEQIEWDKDFEEKTSNLKKSEEDLFEKLRHVMFMEHVRLGDESPKRSDTYLVYNVPRQIIEVMKSEDLENEISQGLVDRYTLVRDLSMTVRACVVGNHEKFSHLFEENT